MAQDTQPFGLGVELADLALVAHPEAALGAAVGLVVEAEVAEGLAAADAEGGGVRVLGGQVEAGALERGDVAREAGERGRLLRAQRLVAPHHAQDLAPLLAAQVRQVGRVGLVHRSPLEHNSGLLFELQLRLRLRSEFSCEWLSVGSKWEWERRRMSSQFGLALR